MLVYYLTDLTKNTIYLLIMLQRQVFSNKLFTKIIKKKKIISNHIYNMKTLIFKKNTFLKGEYTDRFKSYKGSSPIQIQNRSNLSRFFLGQVQNSLSYSNFLGTSNVMHSEFQKGTCLVKFFSVQFKGVVWAEPPRGQSKQFGNECLVLLIVESTACE